MANKNNKPALIQPISFDAPNQKGDDLYKTSSANNSLSSTSLSIIEGQPWWHSQFNTMLCTFSLLALVALLVVVLIPKPQASSLNTVLSSTGESLVSTAPLSISEEIEAPWDETRRQQARSDAQDILSELLVLIGVLEVADVNSWAKDQFDSAVDQADIGDEYYKNKDFAQALNSYSDAQAGLDALHKLIPQVLKERVGAGNDALKAGKSSLAKEKFQQALNLDGNNVSALEGLDKANNLDKLLALVQGAELDEQDFSNKDSLDSLLSAEQKYQQALAFDAQSTVVRQGLHRVTQKLIDKRYRLAMSNGFNALFSDRFNQAKQGFSKALSLKPNDATATSAYRQSIASDKRSSLSSLIKNAKALEDGEEWAQSLGTYQAILQRDPSQVSAKLGVIRSRARDELDQSIRSLLQDTLALSKVSQRQDAEDILEDARAIKRKGALLNTQIAQLENIFKGLDRHRKVEFKSDAFTDVYLVKAGSKKIRLGTFTQKKMALKPGRYVLSGSRLGYVDVRQEIDLQAGSTDIIKLVITCDTPINVAPLTRSS